LADRHFKQCQSSRQHSRSEGRDVTLEAITEMNRLGVDGWEVCSMLKSHSLWLVLLKRKAI
jgi:hypothetical protein